MPESHELADLIHEFNKGENTIQCSGMSTTYTRICSYFAMAGIPFITVPQDTERLIVVLAEKSSWEPVFHLATNLDDDASIRAILDEARNQAMLSTAPVMSAMYPVAKPPACDEGHDFGVAVFQVILTGVTNVIRKIEVIKAIRELKHGMMGLKEAKDCVDASMEGRSCCLAEASTLREANDIAAKLILAGAEVKIHPNAEVPF